MDGPFKGMSVRPWGESFMAGVFIGCVHWATTEEKIRNAFTEKTGLNLLDVCRGGIVGMIDEATGFRGEVVAKFADFVATEVWGLEE